MDYPRFVFQDGGNIQRAGGFYSQLLVHDEFKHADALAMGWFDSIDEAAKGIESKPEEPARAEDDAPPTRAELESKADELGIRYDRRTGDKKLLKLIEEAIGG